jgi:nucleotide-binding universal stress UspA family protein
MAGPPTGPVLFAYDGSDLAKAAITEAARQLHSTREAVVLTVWQPFSVGFVSPHELKIDAAAAEEVRAAAEETAAQGASLAQQAGFKARSMAKEASPAWKGIVDVANELDSTVIVLGSHGRTGIAEMLIGSVAKAVATHSRRPVFITHLGD